MFAKIDSGGITITSLIIGGDNLGNIPGKLHQGSGM